jgi:hypothetical protein
VSRRREFRQSFSHSLCGIKHSEKKHERTDESHGLLLSGYIHRIVPTLLLESKYRGVFLPLIGYTEIFCSDYVIIEANAQKGLINIIYPKGSKQ